MCSEYYHQPVQPNINCSRYRNNESNEQECLQSVWTYPVICPVHAVQQEDCSTTEVLGLRSRGRRSWNTQSTDADRSCRLLIGDKLLLFTHRISRIRAFQWYQNRWLTPWKTQNAIILRYLTEFDSYRGQLRQGGWVRPIQSAATHSTKNLLFGNVWFMVTFSASTEKESVKERYPPLESDSSTCGTIAPPCQ